MPRFKVSTVTGYPHLSAKSTTRPGLTALVLDTWIMHTVVARFRSEERLEGNQYATRGQDGARQAAEAKCAELNARELARA